MHNNALPAARHHPRQSAVPEGVLCVGRRRVLAVADEVLAEVDAAVLVLRVRPREVDRSATMGSQNCMKLTHIALQVRSLGIFHWLSNISSSFGAVIGQSSSFWPIRNAAGNGPRSLSVTVARLIKLESCNLRWMKRKVSPTSKR